jgi:hypothetical protein
MKKFVFALLLALSALPSVAQQGYNPQIGLPGWNVQLQNPVLMTASGTIGPDPSRRPQFMATKNEGKATVCPICRKIFPQPTFKRIFCTRECALKACDRLEA